MRSPVLKTLAALALGAATVAAVVPSTHVAAAGTLSLSWSTTVHVGPGSGPASTVSGEPLGGATIADLFADGRKQVVVGFMDGSVSVLDGLTGAELPGWPQYTGGAMHTNPSVADLNSDGREEVIATSEAGRVYVWNGDGSLAPGWPQHSIPPPHTNPGFFGGVAVGDLFGDGNKELVAASWDQHLYAWNKQGAMLPGFPIQVWDTAFDTPTLVDLEHRGQLDIVVGFDSTGPPYDPYQRGGEVWAFRPTGCVASYANTSKCVIPGWPQTFDQVPWSSPAAADLSNNGSTEIIEGTGFNFSAPAGQYENVWNGAGARLGGWPQPTGGRNMASPAVGDLLGNGQREVVQASSNGLVYAWNAGGSSMPGWPVNLNQSGLLANPTIGPVSATANGVWIINGATLKGFNGAGQQVWAATGLDWGGFGAPAIGDLGGAQLSAVTVDQTTGSAFNSWTVRAFAIPGVTKMLTGAWPTFHGNGQLTGTILPSATLSAMAATQSTTAMTVSWALDANSVPAGQYTLWTKDQGGGGWAPYGRTSSTSMPFYGYPGHSYSFAIQAGSAEPSFSTGITSTSFTSATWSTSFKEMYAVDGHGLLHGGSSAPLANSSSWPSWDIIRGIALAPGGLGGYLLDGFGGLHPVGNAPAVNGTGYWAGWDIARGLVLRADGHSGYVLDGWGNLHPFGTSGDMPPGVNLTGYWQGWDIARDVQLRGDGQSGYVLDGWGGVHPFGVTNDMAPEVQVSGWWQNWDIAHRLVLDAAGAGGYVLDGFGGLHPFGTPGNAPPTATQGAYWSGWDIARGVVLVPGSSTQGYVVDGWGGMHPFGGAPSVSTPNVIAGGIVKQLSIA